MTEQIFISYSKKDSKFAHKLADDLEAAGFKVWIDRSIAGGDQWRESIEANLKAAGDVVIVVSPNSMGSEWVKHEGSLAYGWGKNLFPILIEPAPSLPPWLEEYQWIDFVKKSYQEAFDALVATLTPPNPIQDLLDQQVQVCRQTGDLIGEAILRVVNENRGLLLITDEAQELIAKSQQVIDDRMQREQQLIAEKEEAHRKELQKEEQIRQLELYVARKKTEEAEEQRKLEEARAKNAEYEAQKAIRRSKILRISLLFSVTLLTMTIIGLVWYNYRNQPLSGNLNIATAEFIVIDQHGIDVSKKSGSLGKIFAESVINSVENQMTQRNYSNLTIDIASPNTVGVIVGKNQAERAINARKIAERLNANILFYGVIIVSDKEEYIEFHPEVYFQSSEGLESEELKLFQLVLNGFPSILLIDPSQPETLTFIENSFIAPVINIYIGELYYPLGNFQQVIDSLEVAEDFIRRGSAYNGSASYIEVLLGNIYITLSEQEYSESGIQTAQAHFQQALEMDPENSWAIIGLGDTNYLKALNHLNDDSATEANLAILKQAESAYQTVLALSPPPAVTLSEFQNAEYQTVKAYFGQGQVYLVEGLINKDSTDEKILQSKSIFEEIIVVYGDGNRSIQDLACEAYARLGGIAIIQGKMDDAVNNYKAAIPLCEFGFRQAYYSGVLGDLYVNMGRTEDAITAYTDACDIAAAFGDEETYHMYQDKLNSLTGK